MKSRLKFSLFLIAAVFAFLGIFLTPAFTQTAIYADNTQLSVNNDNGVMYVTTAVDPASTFSATPSGTTVTPEHPLVSPITPPKGFATDIGNVINFVLRVIMVVAVLLVFGYLVWGGIQWIASGGDKGKVEAARNKIMAAILGIIILAASYAILLLLIRFLGFQDLNDLLNNVGTINNPNPQSQTATSSSQLRQQNLVQ